eukprot:1161490-Pelagomonas_calceolata.AAC.2
MTLQQFRSWSAGHLVVKPHYLGHQSMFEMLRACTEVDLAPISAVCHAQGGVGRGEAKPQGGPPNLSHLKQTTTGE